MGGDGGEDGAWECQGRRRGRRCCRCGHCVDWGNARREVLRGSLELDVVGKFLRLKLERAPGRRRAHVSTRCPGGRPQGFLHSHKDFGICSQDNVELLNLTYIKRGPESIMH